MACDHFIRSHGTPWKEEWEMLFPLIRQDPKEQHRGNNSNNNDTGKGLGHSPTADLELAETGAFCEESAPGGSSVASTCLVQGRRQS